MKSKIVVLQNPLKICCGLFLSIYLCLSSSTLSALQDEPTDNFQTAETLFDAALYDRAIPLYQQIRQIKSDPDSLLATYRLAQSYFLTQRYSEVIALNEESTHDPRVLYLVSLSYNKQGDFEKGISLLEQYLENGKNPFTDEAKLELGKAYFFSGKLQESATLLSNLKTDQSHVGDLATLYLSRIFLAQHNPTAADEILSKLILPASDPLHFEVAYLRGEAAFQKENYSESSRYFEAALPTNSPEKMTWYKETLYHLAWSYMRLGKDPNVSKKEKSIYFSKAEETLKKLLDHSSDERTLLALGQCYLAIQDEESYQKAETLFSRQDIFVSPEARAHALLLLAEAAPTYLKRDTLYRHLTQEVNRGTPHYSKGWYLRGLNDLNEGKEFLKAHKDEEARTAFERAVSSFQKAFEHLQENEKTLSAMSLKYQIETMILLENYMHAIAKLEELEKTPHLLMSLSDPDEIFYLYALAAARLADGENGAQYMTLAADAVQKGITQFPKGEFADDALHLLGTLYFRHQENSKAEELFLRLTQEFPESSLAGDSLYWAARCADARQEFSTAKEYRRQTFERYPKSCYAPEAYFTFYSYREYLQGDRGSIKHLQAMADHFPQSPFLIHAWYLIGLDYERDRKTAAGKWIRKKNLTAAIDAFQESESIFDTLFQQGLLLTQDLDFLTMIRYRAVLERALANLTIADEAQGAKRQIYLEYAEEVLKQIVSDCRDPNHPLKPHMTRIKSHGSLEDESTYWLSQACIKSNNDLVAEKILNEMIEKYRSAKITRGYFLSRSWYDKGMIAFRAQNPSVGLECLQHAEDAAKGNVLSVEEKLDLWIQQSACYQEMKDLDNAILILSKVVNDDSISSLRVKAMYLRADAYERQGRRELARKQLEATAKKGGEWASKAKEKLDKQYGYQ